MTRPVILKSALALLLLCMAAPVSAVFAGGDVNFLLGYKPMDEDFWGPVDSQGAFGAQVTFGREAWPVWIAIDYFVSTAVEERVPVNVFGFTSDQDIAGATVEFDLGIRKIWGKGKHTRPFLGGGIGLVGGTLDLDIVDDSDYTAAPWADAGVFWRLGRRFNIGGTVRYSKADVTIFDEDVRVGGFTYGLLLGWGWPAGS
jgi:hypothetical protein